MVSKFFDEMFSGGAVACADKSATRSAFTVNQHLSVELHKPINEKIEKPKVYPSYRDNVWVLILQICN